MTPKLKRLIHLRISWLYVHQCSGKKKSVNGDEKDDHYLVLRARTENIKILRFIHKYLDERSVILLLVFLYKEILQITTSQELEPIDI